MKRLLYCLSFFLLLGCRRVADFDFDTQTQSLTINDGYFYDICFENDSVTSDGKLYEGALLLIWEDSTCVPPKKNKLSNIPRGYTISRGGLPSRSEKINLKAHSVYTISSTGMGAVECRIKVWTNQNGKVVKTIKLSQTDESIEE